jgi:hypothetical protein
LRPTQRRFDLIQFGQEMTHPLVIGGAVARDMDASRRPLEQLHPQVPFELLNLLTHRGIGHLQGVRGTSETAGFHYTGEGPDRLHVVHDGSFVFVELSTTVDKDSIFGGLLPSMT